MDNIIFFLTFMTWLFNVTLFLLGLGIGTLGAITLGPGVYRTYRRWSLRRDWREDRPNRVVESLTPQWEGYDPDLAGVGKRCICHNRQIHPGEHVLLWPETGPMGVLHVAVYCENIKERL
jgi:hypothetical protein